MQVKTNLYLLKQENSTKKSLPMRIYHSAQAFTFSQENDHAQAFEIYFGFCWGVA